MRQRPLVWIIAAVAAVVVLVGSIAVVGYTRQQRLYTVADVVDLNTAPTMVTPSPSSPVTQATQVVQVQPSLPSPAQTELPGKSTGNHETLSPSTPSAVASRPTIPTSPTQILPTATIQASPTQAPPTATPEPQPEVAIFYDDFTALTSGWDPLYLSNEYNVNGYSAGQYRFDIISPDHLLYDIHKTQQVMPGTYTVEVSDLRGRGEAGILFDVVGDVEQPLSLSYYQVSVTNDGQIRVQQQTAGAGRVLAEAQINGLRDQFRLSVVLAPPVIEVGVDGRSVLRAENINLQDGRLGLMARSDSQPFQVAFDNFLTVAQRNESHAACSQIRQLTVGVTGRDVVRMQMRLAELGYAVSGTGQVDGTMDTVVTEFQRAMRLDPTGVVDQATWCALFSSEAMRSDGQTERDAEAAFTRTVTLDTPGDLSAPLLLSIRQSDENWQLALALPGRDQAYYLETQGDAYDPAWSPDRRWLAFTSERSGRTAIWLLELATGDLRQISPPSLYSQFPAWSPESRAIIFTSEPNSREPLAARDYIYDLTTGETRMLDDEHAGWADWSSRDQLVVTRHTGKSFDLFLVDPRDGSEVNLTNTNDINEDIPAWSPDGRQIVFVGNPRPKPQQRHVYLMDADGTNIRQLTTMSGPNSNPVWSADGKTLAFANQPSEDVRQPWLVDLSNGNVQRLSDNSDRIWFMQWVP